MYKKIAKLTFFICNSKNKISTNKKSNCKNVVYHTKKTQMQKKKSNQKTQWQNQQNAIANKITKQKKENKLAVEAVRSCQVHLLVH
jgi:hypothetical protein